MRRLAFLLALSLLPNAVLAQRPSTLNMSCAEVQATVARAGAIVLSTGRNTYNRYVANRGQCLWGEFMDYEWVPTADGRCRLQVCLPEPPYLLMD